MTNTKFKELSEEMSKLKRQLEIILDLSGYYAHIILDDLSGLKSADERQLLIEYTEYLFPLAQIQAHLSYHNRPIEDVSRLHKNKVGIYETDSGYCYTSGSFIEFLRTAEIYNCDTGLDEVVQIWTTSYIDCKDGEYYIVGYPDVKMDNLNVRLRADEEYEEYKFITCSADFKRDFKKLSEEMIKLKKQTQIMLDISGYGKLDGLSILDDIEKIKSMNKIPFLTEVDISEYGVSDDLLVLKSADERQLLIEYAGILFQLKDIQNRLSYYSCPIKEVSRLHKNKVGIYETDSGYCYTSRSFIEFLRTAEIYNCDTGLDEVVQIWTTSYIDCRDGEYYIVGYPDIKMDNLNVRLRSNKEYEEDKSISDSRTRRGR